MNSVIDHSRSKAFQSPASHWHALSIQSQTSVTLHDVSGLGDPMPCPQVDCASNQTFSPSQPTNARGLACVWLSKNSVNLIYRDDVWSAFSKLQPMCWRYFVMTIVQEVAIACVYVLSQFLYHCTRLHVNASCQPEIGALWCMWNLEKTVMSTLHASQRLAPCNVCEVRRRLERLEVFTLVLRFILARQIFDVWSRLHVCSFALQTSTRQKKPEVLSWLDSFAVQTTAMFHLAMFHHLLLLQTNKKACVIRSTYVRLTSESSYFMRAWARDFVRKVDIGRTGKIATDYDWIFPIWRDRTDIVSPNTFTVSVSPSSLQSVCA